jgi:phosphoribosylformylglycinamidine synthase
VRFGVLQFPGSCDDRDAVDACARIGEARLVWHEERDLDGIDVVVVPGGFSYGDYLRAGAIAQFAPAMEGSRDTRRAAERSSGSATGSRSSASPGSFQGLS